MIDLTFLPAPLLAAGSNAALVTFLIYTMAVFGLAAASNQLLKSKSFVSEYFLGSRSLGVWAFALTFAATSASGGSFTGFPSKIYTHGWILGLWIGSYIVVPICAMGLLGKRINQVARKSGAITVPDVLRDRFNSASFGLLAVCLIVFFMSFNLVAQFKSGSKILIVLLEDVEMFKDGVAWMGHVKDNFAFLQAVDADYLLCLITFAVAVIIYTTYGGFHAVVWTDVMQGVVMVIGVLILLPLAIAQVGGLGGATKQMAEMTPPRLGFATIRLQSPLESTHAINTRWFTLPGEDGETPRLFRLNAALTIPPGATDLPDQKVVELTTPAEIEQQLKRLEDEAEVAILANELRELRTKQLAADGAPTAEVQSALDAIPDISVALLNTENGGLTITPEDINVFDYTYGAGEKGMYVTGPGPTPQPLKNTLAETQKAVDQAASQERDFDGFLPLSIAISFFFMWAISGAGQPSSMVRLMAFNNATTLRRSIFTVAMYYSMIYFPLVIIFCCSRIILPGMDLDSDRIMPQMAVTLTTQVGQGWLAGLLVAAPFAAVMSTVDSFLLMISSALVRDIYQRNVNPEAPEKTIKRLSFLFTFLVGAGAMLGAINPPQFLQDIIVYTGSGLAACFLAPMVYALYWPRANVQGCIASMLSGFGAHLAMYVAGIFVNDSFFKPLQLFNFNPIIIGLAVSFIGGYVVTRITPPPSQELVRRYFYKAG